MRKLLLLALTLALTVLVLVSCAFDGSSLCDGAHTFTSYVSNGDATCTQDGTKSAVCDVCGSTATVVDEGTRLGHTVTEYTSNSDATCTQDGTKSGVCSVCGLTDTVTDENTMTSHDFDTDTYLYDTEYHYHKCKGCSATDEKIPHSFVVNVCSECAYVHEDPSYAGVTVIHPGDEVNIIVAENDDALKLFDCYNEFVKLGYRSWICDIYEPVCEYEIVFGLDRRRDISVKAYELLYAMDKQSYYDMRYLVYADSGKICVAYDYNEYTTLGVVDLIKDAFFDKLTGGKDYIAIDKGVMMSGKIDLIAEQKKLDDANLEAEWDARRTALIEKWGEEKGLEIYEAFRDFYTLCDDGLVIWAANLYDSGVGGYYVGSSGRDHVGFAPSPEITDMHLRVASFFGAPEEMRDMIPDVMKYQIVYFIKSVQDPDGYFYPPAAKRSDYRKGGVAARARNLAAALSLLRSYGALPTYDTPSGEMIGDGKTADEYWQDLRDLGLVNQDPPVVPKNADDITSAHLSLRMTSAVAVSDIIDSSVSLTSTNKNELNDYKLFIDWIEKQNLKKGPYGAGNNIQARSAEIKAASEKMQPATYTPSQTEADNPKYAKYAGLSMRQITIKYLNDNVNPDTGLWGDPEIAKPGQNAAGTEFLFTNGFFKVVSSYNILGAPLPYPEKAAEALLRGTVSNEPSNTNSCDVYNIWAGITMLQDNVKTQYKGEANKEIREATLNKIDELITEFGAEPILISFEKQKRYQKEDGSFSHNVNTSNPLHQGPHPVGLGWREGDIDAIGKCLWGTLAPIIKVYGAGGVSYYQEHHCMMYIEILVSNGPIIKCQCDTDGHTMDECVPNQRAQGPVFEPIIVKPATDTQAQAATQTETATLPASSLAITASDKKYKTA
ncbi:MAG: hypothetical protein J6Q85_00800 [Clostridia bacterium]|nr:hypothetical protein [Clostridia bacterium]